MNGEDQQFSGFQHSPQEESCISHVPPTPLSHSSHDQTLHVRARGPHQLTAEAGLPGDSRAQQVGVAASQVEGLHGGRMQQRVEHGAHEARVAQVHQPSQA